MNCTPWYEEWFGSGYYRMLYSQRNEAEASECVDRLVETLSISRRNRIIDIACGLGRHARRFHQLGYDVTGVDLCGEYITEAQQTTAPGLSFQVVDMRQVHLLNTTFSCAVNLFTSFGYFEDMADNLQTLRSFNLVLDKDGVLLIDFMNSHRVCQQLVSHEMRQENGLVFEITRCFENGRIVKRIKVIDGTAVHWYAESVSALTLTDFQALFAAAGFVISQVYGGYDLAPYNRATSDRLILVATK